MPLPNAIKNRITDFMESLKDNNNRSLVFFKGFPSDVYKLLKEKEYSSLSIDKWLDNKGYINVIELENSSKELLVNFLTMNATVVWGFYEEFIALTNTFTDIKQRFDGEIIVLENNLFAKYYPLDIESSILNKLMEYFSSESIEMTSEISPYIRYYSDAEYYSNGDIGISFINRHMEENIDAIPFYNNIDIPASISNTNYKNISAQSTNIFSLKKTLQNGESIGDINIIIDTDRERGHLLPFIYLLNLTESNYSITVNERFKDLTKEDGNRHLKLFQRYWGDDKTFRAIKFYKNPDVSNELMEISQGHIINEIISQCECALNNVNEFHDMLITAPTGAGKSLLFQIPAIYMAEEHKTITIIITPLIALMRDQVDNLYYERGVEYVTFINSEISFDEKERRIAKIKNNEYSILYLSPELFLGNSLVNIIGDRKIALLVVDEAHLVTTWGREFRADYWYLGEYINKLRRDRKQSCQFPILCLTATAVYMGNEDTVDDTVNSLNLNNPIIHLGNVKRENILFNIRTADKPAEKGGLDEFKVQKSVEHIIHCIDTKTKSIVYCPYTSQVEDIYNSLDSNYKKYVGKYYGSFDKYEKAESQNKFKYGDYLVMISTKAFGMGVDIKDIERVYHFAPTGNLADYIQEVGRAARNPEVEGVAATDFTPLDMKYVRALYGSSGIRQYQLKEMIRKLYSMYSDKKSRNLLISPEAFSYLFSENELENKTKSGLLLISKDFERRYTFPVINVRPKMLFTKNFVSVPLSIEKRFLESYGSYARLIADNTKRVVPSLNRNGDITVYNNGNIYELNMSALWEKHFDSYTFAGFKKSFFEGELFDFQCDEKISPRLNLKITFESSFDRVCENLKEYSQKLSSIFSYFKSRGKVFTKAEFRERFNQQFDNVVRLNELPGIILDTFVADISQNDGFNSNSDKLKFIQQRKAHNKDDLVYRIMNSNFTLLKNYLTRLIHQCHPNVGGNTFSVYISVAYNNKKPELLYLAVLLELFGLATYEVIGGRNREIFIRINDPNKLKRAAFSSYSNYMLREIERKRERSQSIIRGFMLADLSDTERWDIIEDYFLGKDDEVSLKLGLDS